jgi:hypothetical protein
MKSNKSSKSNSPTKSPRHIFSQDFTNSDHHADFETELNRSLGKLLSDVQNILIDITQHILFTHQRQKLARKGRKGIE